MIEIHPDTYYVGMWNAAFPGGDFMCCMWKDPNTQVWVAKYRFRYYRDGKAFDSEDVKAWYKLTAKDGGEESKDALKKAIIHALNGGQLAFGVTDVTFIECEGYGDKFMKQLQEPHGFLHMKQLTGKEAEEAEKRYGVAKATGPSGRA